MARKRSIRTESGLKTLDSRLQIVYKPLTWLQPYERNPRKNDGAVDRMVASIREYGFTVPILARSSGEVVDGHLRIKAAAKLAIAEVPVILCDGWSEAQVKAFRLLVNRSVGWADWDVEALAAEFADLKAMDFDLTMTGFDTREIDQFTLQVNPAEDDVPPVPETPVTRTGDLWLMGGHRLLCGDAKSQGDAAMVLTTPIAMVLTDPPYGINLDTDWSKVLGSLGRQNGTRGKAYRRIEGDAEPFDASSVVGVGGVTEQFWFGGDYYAKTLPQAGSWLVWDKRKPSQDEGFGSGFELVWCRQKHKRMILRHEWFGFLSGGDREAVNRQHPTQKPTSLLRDIMDRWGQAGEIVYDPFLGSGSTLLAAELMERRCFGLEIDPAYCDVIVTRWQNLTGKCATLEGHGATFEQTKHGRLQESEDVIKEEVFGG